MFFNQLEKACKSNKTTVTKAAVTLGISKSNVTNWKNGTTPNGDVVVRLSELLSVSTDFLLKGEEHNISNDNSSSLLLEQFEKLTQAQKNIILRDIERFNELNDEEKTLNGDCESSVYPKEA